MTLHLLETLLLRSAPELTWVRSRMEADEVSALEVAFRTARLHVSDQPWRPDREMLSVLEDNSMGWLVGTPVPDLAASLFVLRAAKLTAHPQALVETWFDTSDQRGRRTILRTLPLLPRARCYLPIAIRALRSNDAGVFSAICFDNPYASTFFSRGDFRELVSGLKARGMVGEIGRVLGRTERASEDGEGSSTLSSTQTLIALAQANSTQRS